MGNVIVLRDKLVVMGSRRISYGTMQMSTSYATSGDSYDKDEIGLKDVERIMLNQPLTGRVLVPNEATGKILAYTAADPAVEVGAIDISADIVNYMAIGY